jgi:hypothetical protein
MLTIQQIRARLADRNLRVVAEAIDVHPQSLYRIMNGTEPSYRILRALSDYLEATCRL